MVILAEKNKSLGKLKKKLWAAPCVVVVTFSSRKCRKNWECIKFMDILGRIYKLCCGMNSGTKNMKFLCSSIWNCSVYRELIIRDAAQCSSEVTTPMIVFHCKRYWSFPYLNLWLKHLKWAKLQTTINSQVKKNKEQK